MFTNFNYFKFDLGNQDQTGHIIIQCIDSLIEYNISKDTCPR